MQPGLRKSCAEKTGRRGGALNGEVNNTGKASWGDAMVGRVGGKEGPQGVETSGK